MSSSIFISILLFVIQAGSSQAEYKIPESLKEVPPAELNQKEKALGKWIEKQEKQMLKDLEKMVAINTGTLNKEGLDEYRNYLQKKLKGLGFKTKTLDGGKVPKFSCEGGEIQFSDHLLAEKAGASQKILLSGHMDTVFNKNHEFQKFIRQGEIIRGPGVLDMKGGILVMLYALKALKNQGELNDAHISIILNSDEEMGSLGSNKLLSDLAKNHDLGLVFEGSSGNRITRTRKGLGQARLVFNGKASHAGSSHHKGVSAVKELAHKVLKIEKLTDYNKGVTVNVGMVQGGEARNTVPPCAEAYVDLRYPKVSLGQKLLKRIKDIGSIVDVKNPETKDEVKTKVWGVLHRPAKEENKKTDEMLKEIFSISKTLGLELRPSHSGGGTDGSIMQAAGLPTVDSLGLIGSGAHSNRELIKVSSLVHRTHLAAIYLRRLIRQKKK